MVYYLLADIEWKWFRSVRFRIDAAHETTFPFVLNSSLDWYSIPDQDPT
jgi:hypothetical protein